MKRRTALFLFCFVMSGLCGCIAAPRANARFPESLDRWARLSKSPRRRVRGLVAIALFVCGLVPAAIVFPAPAFADCTAGGKAGDMLYNKSYHVPQYCDGNSWMQMAQKQGVGGAGCAAPVSLTNGLVGWWKLDDGSGTSAADSSGSANTGTTKNSPAWTTGGYINGALTFNGTNQYVQVADAASLRLAGSWTVSSWVNAVALPTSGTKGKVVERDNSSANANYALAIDNNSSCGGLGWRLAFNDTGGATYQTCYLTSISTGAWYFVTGVWDSSASNLLLYLNGILVSTQNFSGHVPTAAAGTILAIGSQNAGAQFLNATLDDVRVYNRALSATEISSLYNGTGPGHEGEVLYNADKHVPQFCDGSTWIPMAEGWPTTGLVGYWKLDETSGTSAADSSGNGNTGTLTGANASFVAGHISNALSLGNVNANTSGLVNVANPSNFAFDLNQPFTLAAWIYHDTTVTRENDIMGKEDPSNGYQGYSLWIPGNGQNCGDNCLEVSFADSGFTDTFYADTNTNTFSANTWHHVVATYDGSSSNTGIKIYIDGVSQSLNTGTTGGSLSSILNSKPFQIGGNGDSDGTTDTGKYTFNGKIDDARVYNRALSPQEIAKLAGVSNLSTACGPVSSSGLIHYWKLDEPSGGTTAVDTAGGANAPLTGTATFTAAGKNGRALYMPDDGTVKHASVATPADLLNKSALTVSMWFKDISSTNGPQIGQQTVGGPNTIGIEVDPANSRIACEVGTSGADAQGYISITNDANWHLVTMVFDGSQAGNAGRLKCYLDGVAQTLSFTGTIPAATTANAGTFYIGGIDGQSYELDAGYVDDLRVYSRALSNAEVAQLYGNGNEGDIFYNSDAHVPQYCDGTNWQQLGSRRIVAPSGSGSGGDLVGWWKLDDAAGTTAVDSSGNGHTGTTHNAPAWGAGKIAGGLILNAASSQYVTVPDAAALDIAGSWTVSAWVNMASLPTSGNTIKVITRDDSSGYTDYGLAADNNHKCAGLGWRSFYNINGTSGGVDACYITPIAIGTWYHLVGVYDSSAANLYFYLNGQLMTTTSAVGNPPSPGSGPNLEIGAESGGDYLNGTVDDVRLYNRALSAAEIRDLYDSGGTTQASSDLTGWWKLDEASGTVASDSSGGGHPGTLLNAPTWGTTAGMSSGALSFTAASSQDVTTGQKTSTFITQNAFTIAAWVQPTGATSSAAACNIMQGMVVDDNDAVLMNRGTWTTAGGWNGTDALWIGAYGNVDTCMPVPYTANAWTHLVEVFDPTTQNLIAYKNGAFAGQIFTNNATISSNITTDNFLFGYNPRAPLYFGGKLDDIRTYNRALTASEVLSLYNLTGGTSGDAASGLVGWWKLDDGAGTSAADSSGNGNTGTLTNGPAWIFGKNAGALTFNGTTQYVDAGDPASLRLGGSWTEAVWINPAALPSSGNIVTPLSKDDGGGHTNYDLDIDNGLFSAGLGFAVHFNTVSTYTDYFAKYVTAISTGTWYHVVGVYDSVAQTLTLYLNGSQVATSSVSGHVPTSSSGQSLTIGNANTGAYTAGTIDDVRVYNRALSAADVLTLYNTTGGESATVPDIVQMSQGPTNLGVASPTYAFPADNTAGNMSTVLITGSNACSGNCGTHQVGTVTSVTDTNGNAYKLIPATYINKNGTNYTWIQQIAYASNIAAGPNTVTVNFSGTPAYSQISLAEIKNASTVDVTSTGNGSSTTPATGAVTTGFGNEECLAQFEHDAGTATNGVAAGSNWLMRFGGGTGNGGVEQANRLVPAAGTSVAGNETITASDIWSATMGCFTGPAPTSGLAGWWKLDEASSGTTPTTAADSSGNGNSGTLTNSPTWAAGKVNNALTLNGTNSYVTMGNITALNGLAQMTVSAWVKSSASGANSTEEKHIADKSSCNGTSGGTDGPFDFAVSVLGNWGKAWFSAYGTSTNASSGPSSTSVDDGNWHFVVGLYDGSTASIWVDGVQQNSGSIAAQSLSTTAYPMEIGGYCNGNYPNGGSPYIWSGRIDDVRVYNRALSAAEIWSLYNGGP